MNPVAPLGCLYLSIQIESMFIYGRGARERSEFYWLKASYFTLKFHPRIGPRSENRTQLVRLRAGYFATKV